MEFLQRKIPPPRGTIRILCIPYYDPMNWVHRDLMYRDFTFQEWMKFIDKIETPIFPTSKTRLLKDPIPEYKTGDIPNPWFHRHIAAGIFRGIVLWNIRMRWICRKWIYRVRSRILSRRIIGANDLATMEPISDEHMVQVTDYKSRSTYQFHCHTIQRIFQESLLFQSYGISCPVPPKNPYTNLPWTLGQIIMIMDQIQTISWKRRHRFIHPLLQWYRESDYSIQTLQKEHSHELCILAAGSFFKDVHNPDVQEIVEEVLVDLLEELELPKKGRVFHHVSKRSILPDLQKQWDNMILYIWIYQNYRRVLHPEYTLYTSLLEGILKLYDKTLEWIVSKRPNRRRQNQEPM